VGKGSPEGWRAQVHPSSIEPTSNHDVIIIVRHGAGFTDKPAPLLSLPLAYEGSTLSDWVRRLAFAYRILAEFSIIAWMGEPACASSSA
jgi:hypothetical protein